jgi:hypothetical protein
MASNDLAVILESLNPHQASTDTDNARFAPIFNGPFPPRLVFPDENPKLRLLPNGWGGAAVGAWRNAPAPPEDPEEAEHNRMLRLLPMGFRCEQAAHEDDEEEDEHEDESESEDEEGEGEREVFSNGGTPWAPEMEDQEFCKPVEEEEEDDYDPEWLVAEEEEEVKPEAEKPAEEMKLLGVCYLRVY